jgi:hypothetical protein
MEEEEQEEEEEGKREEMEEEKRRVRGRSQGGSVISNGSSNNSSTSSSSSSGLGKLHLYLSTRPEVKVTSDEEMELIWAGPAVLHTKGEVIRVQFALVLLTAAHLIERELLHTFLAIVAIQQNLYQLVHCCAV